jgi:hypothetical protein
VVVRCVAGSGQVVPFLLGVEKQQVVPLLLLIKTTGGTILHIARWLIKTTGGTIFGGGGSTKKGQVVPGFFSVVVKKKGRWYQVFLVWMKILKKLQKIDNSFFKIFQPR